MPVIDFLIRLRKQRSIALFLETHLQLHIEYHLEPFKNRLASDRAQLENDLGALRGSDDIRQLDSKYKKCRELRLMSVKLECANEVDTDFSRLESGFEHLSREMHREEQEVIDRLKKENTFDIDFEPVLEQYNSNLERERNENSIRILRLIRKFFVDKQKKLKRRLDSYRLDEDEEFEQESFVRYMEALIEVSYVCHHLNTFKGIEKDARVIPKEQIDREMASVEALITKFFEETMACVEEISSASQDFVLFVSRFGEAEEAAYRCIHERKNSDHNELKRRLKQLMGALETRVMKSLVPLGYRNTVVLHRGNDYTKNLLIEYHERSIKKLEDLYGDKKEFKYDATFQKFYHYLQAKEPLKLQEIQEKMEERVNGRLKELEANFEGELRAKEAAEVELKREIDSLSALQIPLAEQFRSQYRNTVEQLEQRVESNVQKAVEALKSDVSQRSECLQEMKKALTNKQSEIAQRFTERLRTVYCEVEKKHSGIRERLSYVQDWLEAPLDSHMKLLEETGFKRTIITVFNQNLRFIEVQVKARLSSVTKAFAASLENYDVSEKRSIEEMHELFDALSYLFLLKDKHSHNLEALNGVFTSSQEGLEKLFEVIGERVAPIKITPSLLS